MTPLLTMCLTLSFHYICTSIHMNFWCIYSLDQYLFRLHSSIFEANLDIEPKNFLKEFCSLNFLLKGLECPPDPTALLMFTILTFLLVMFTVYS